MKKENIYIDISKCSEKEINRIFSLLPKDEITAQIYYMIRNSDWEVLKSFSHLFFNENSVWQLCSNRSTETYGKTELTYPEFIKLFEEPKLPSELLKEYFKNTPREQVLQDWESTVYLDNTNSPKIRELFEGYEQTDEKGRPMTYLGGKENKLIKVEGGDGENNENLLIKFLEFHYRNNPFRKHESNINDVREFLNSNQ